MIPAYYINKAAYCPAWRAADRFGRTLPAAAYCAVPLDVVVLRPVLRHLPPMPIASADRATIAYAVGVGMRVKVMPVFPRLVLMSRHAAHRFPCDGIGRIGFRHGAYTFKAFAGAQYYNAFDAYFVTGQSEVRRAEAHGIRSARAVGFPKLDPAFDGTWNTAALEPVAERMGLDRRRPTVVFTATWDGSGMSAVDRWIPVLPGLAGRYNVLVTVHPWTSGRHVRALRRMEGIRFIEDPDVLPYLMLSDCLIGDSSSIIAEFCALDKPIVTFRVPAGRRSVPEVRDMLGRISLRIDGAGDLPSAIEHALSNPAEHAGARREASLHMFDRLDGKAGLRAAEAILEMRPELKVSI